MTGQYPTVEILVALRGMTTRIATKELQVKLQPLLVLIPQMDSHRIHLKAWCLIANTCVEAIFYSTHESGVVYTHLVFDEQTIVSLCQTSRIDLIDAISPFIDRLKTLQGAFFLGVGFEPSVPTGFGDDELIEAGISTGYYAGENSDWTRRDILPMKGHDYCI